MQGSDIGIQRHFKRKLNLLKSDVIYKVSINLLPRSEFKLLHLNFVKYLELM
jgi:hypothetical protein